MLIKGRLESIFLCVYSVLMMVWILLSFCFQGVYWDTRLLVVTTEFIHNQGCEFATKAKSKRKTAQTWRKSDKIRKLGNDFRVLGYNGSCTFLHILYMLATIVSANLHISFIVEWIVIEILKTKNVPESRSFINLFVCPKLLERPKMFLK